MLEVILWIVLGILAGAFAGLCPGIHPNIFCSITLGIVITTGLDPMSAALFLISAGIVNSFTNFIPAVLLGAPSEEENALSALPGHRLLMQGRAYEAIKLTVIGGIGSVILAILFLPAFALAIPAIYQFLKPIIHWILIFIISYMIFGEKTKKDKLFAVLIFFLSGFLGIISLNYSSDFIFPLLSGLFGLPTLLLSLKDKSAVPKNLGFESTDIGKKNVLSGIFIGTIAGTIVGLFPGIGSAQATVLAQEASGRERQEIADRKFLISTGCVSCANTIFALIALILISKGRSGLAVAVGKLVEISWSNVFVFISVILLTAGIGALLTLKLTKIFMNVIRKLDYGKLSLSVFILIWILVGVFSGLLGLFVCAVALAIGMIPNLADVKKSHAMGCLLLPVILFFWGII